MTLSRHNIYICIHIDIYTHIYIYTYMYTHIYIYTHTFEVLSNRDLKTPDVLYLECPLESI